MLRCNDYVSQCCSVEWGGLAAGGTGDCPRPACLGGKVGARQWELSDWSAGQQWANVSFFANSHILAPTVLYVGASAKSVLTDLRYNRECW
jgi:hypothetical protein